jgi:Tfp pilus assembly protein PilP
MKSLMIFAMALIIVGCGGSSNDETVGQEIADDLNEAMDKAREVEDQIMQHKDEIDDAVEDAEKAIEDTLD